MTTTRDARMISVVVPVYGCVHCLALLCERLVATLQAIADRHEIILVDDRSPDGSWVAIQELCSVFPTVRGIRLSRNFGQHIAISAGLARAAGDLAVVLDCDLQDPPELIPRLLAALPGHDLVLARRITRNHSALRVVAARLYFKLISRLAEEKVDGSYGTFSLLTRKVIDAFLRFSERERHYLFIIRWLGFSSASVDYEHQERHAGVSTYSFKKLARHAMEGILFQATVLLRWIVLLGFILAAAGAGLAAYFVWVYLAYSVQPGWTSLAVLILFSTGIILISLGVIGLYIGKIFDQAKLRPLFVVDEALGFVAVERP